jgi:alginate O-acetyltransferase complex protein AlgI
MITSVEFWLILVGTVTVYWLLPRGRMAFLGGASYLYLVTLDPRSIVGLTIWTGLFYFLAPKAAGKDRRSRWLLAFLVLGMLAYLAYFKYVPPLLAAFATNPLSERLLIPLGISYFTFKLIHYALETARGRISGHSFASFFTYVFLFPIFSAGPIERFDHFLANREQKVSRELLAEGGTRILQGLIKKFVFAELIIYPLLAEKTTALLLDDARAIAPLRTWLHLALAYAYFYLDFSSYSDIAIGGARLFGFRVTENFNFPFLAPNISNFWNRWHISLSNWCRSYVYMPVIGWTRNPYLATYATFAAIGLWHAGNWNQLSWGLYHATGITIFQAWGRMRRRYKWKKLEGWKSQLVGTGITIVFVTGSYVFIVTEHDGGIGAAFRMAAKLFGVG